MAPIHAVDHKNKDGKEDDESINSKDVDNESEDSFALDKYLEVNTKFLHACKNNDIDGEFGVKYWISQGADVNYWDNDDYYYGLKYAAIENYPELCDFLLAQPNIDVNSAFKSRDYYSTDHPLNLAIKYGHTEIVRKLVKAPGIDLNCQLLWKLPSFECLWCSMVKFKKCKSQVCQNIV